MLFLNILLCILKIIGITVLVVLGIVVLLLCLLLFVPIRYEAYASFFGSLHVSAHVTYLLKLLHVEFKFDEGQSELKIKIFGHNISDKKDKSEEEAVKDEQSDIPVKKADDTIKAGGKDTGSIDEPVPDFEEKSKDKTVKTKTKADGTAGGNKNKPNPADKIKAVAVLLKANRPVLNFIFGQLKLLLKHVLPGSHVINIKLGLDDPALLGEILGAAAVLRAMTGLVINITPVWNEKVFEAEADLRGRIILGRILFIAARVYFNKDVKKFIKEVKNI